MRAAAERPDNEIAILTCGPHCLEMGDRVGQPRNGDLGPQRESEFPQDGRPIFLSLQHAELSPDGIEHVGIMA